MMGAMRPPPGPLLLLATLAALASGSGEDERPDFWLLVERAAEEGGARSELETVLEHLRGVGSRRSNVANRLSRVMTTLEEPWRTPELAADLRARLERPALGEPGAFPAVLGSVAAWLDLDTYEEPGPACEHPGLVELDGLWREIEDPDRRGHELLEVLSSYVGLAHALLDESLAGFEPGDWATLFEGHARFYEAWYRDHFPGASLTDEQAAAVRAFEGLVVRPRTNRPLLLGVASALLRMAERPFLDSLPRRLARVKRGASGAELGPDVLASVGAAPSERVVLTGRKGSEHAFPAALTIDLGGDDTYTRAAVVDGSEMLVSVVLELGGDDVFGSGEGAGPAFAAGGMALLVDRRGNDRYVSRRSGQASTMLGCAALVDHEGDDAYEAEDYAQAHAACGVALLYDLEGDDAYGAWAFAQGAGIGYGLSALVDGEGSDRYLADLHWPDVYGNSGPDVYHGASQGYATGIRPAVAGGVAALLDLGDGKDRYQAGSFSQGGGYYFSFGLQFDGGGDDESFGSRYAQGFGVHQGAGVRWDAGGDDLYTCRSVAHAGMGWDEGVGFLIEDGGDDVYRTGDLSCGGAAQTAIAVCLERGGADEYHTGRQSQGGTGSSEYHDKPSIGVLLDLGGGRDASSDSERGDGALRVTDGVEVFLDSKARDAKKARKGRRLR